MLRVQCPFFVPTHSRRLLPKMLLEAVVIVLGILVGANASGAKFDPLQHSGPASPYFDAPSQFGISSATPARCSVDQAAYILRHGSWVVLLSIFMCGC